MFDLLDTLIGTVKPDYRNEATLAYRMSKPASYYERQVKMRKARPGQFPAKDLGPKALPDVEAFVAGVKLSAHNQVFSYGWHLGDVGKTKLGETYYGICEAKTLEDCARLAHKAITERRVNIRPVVEKGVKPIDPMFCLFDSLESLTDAIKSGMPTDRLNKHQHKEWGSVVAVERDNEWTLASGSMIPVEFSDWRLWNGSEWNAPMASKEVVLGSNFAPWRSYDLPKGADWLGLVDGIEMTWKELKDLNGGESSVALLEKGRYIGQHYDDPICIDGTRIAVERIKKVLGNVNHVEIAWNMDRGNYGHKVRANGVEWFIMSHRFTEHVARPMC